MFGKTQTSTLTSIHGTSGSVDMLYGSHECLASTVAWQAQLLDKSLANLSNPESQSLSPIS